MSKKKQKLVVGTWEDGVFTEYSKQPDEEITDMAEMLAWAKQAITEQGGYSFIREVPGALVVESRTQLDMTFV